MDPNMVYLGKVSLSFENNIYSVIVEGNVHECKLGKFAQQCYSDLLYAY